MNTTAVDYIEPVMVPAMCVVEGALAAKDNIIIIWPIQFHEGNKNNTLYRKGNEFGFWQNLKNFHNKNRKIHICPKKSKQLWKPLQKTHKP